MRVPGAVPFLRVRFRTRFAYVFSRPRLVLAFVPCRERDDRPAPPGAVFVCCHPLWSFQLVQVLKRDPALGVPFTCAGVTGFEPASGGFGDRCSSG